MKKVMRSELIQLQEILRAMIKMAIGYKSMKMETKHSMMNTDIESREISTEIQPDTIKTAIWLSLIPTPKNTEDSTAKVYKFVRMKTEISI